MVRIAMVDFHPARRLVLLAAALGALALPAMLVSASIAPVSAKSRGNTADKLEQSLMKLDPAERISQVCDLSAMKALGRDAAYKKTDRVLIDAAAAPKVTGDKVTGDGGALRLGDTWFRFSFACTLAPDHMSATDFRYKVIGPIPEEKWAEFGLWR
jgi:hypothetical protein